MRKPLDILIIGGGIAGCCAAIALSQGGHQVRIVEKQAEWRFQSSGIFVYANGLESLDRLGLLESTVDAGFAILSGLNQYFDDAGALIVETVYPSSDPDRIPPILGIKRAELHRIMAARVAALHVRVQLGTTATSLVEANGGVEVALSDGTRGCYDLVIAADGIGSATRAQIGIAVDPTYTGFGVWRSVHRRPKDVRAKIMMMGRGKRFGIMPISDDMLYTFGTVLEPKSSRFDPAEWPAEMKAKFAEFQEPAAPFLEQLGAESEVLYTAVEEVLLPPPWHRGRVVLIGDAAHASTPFMGQGGAMAMQDALVLASAVARAPSLEDALCAFAEARYRVCQFVQTASRAVGDAGAQEQGRDLGQRDRMLRQTAQSRVDDFYARLAELNAQGYTVLEKLGRLA